MPKLKYFPIHSSIWYKSKSTFVEDQKLYTTFLDNFCINRLRFRPSFNKDDLIYKTYYRPKQVIRSIVNLLTKEQNQKSNHKLINIKLGLFSLKKIYQVFKLSQKAFNIYPSIDRINFWQFLWFNLRNGQRYSRIFLFYNGLELSGFLSYYIDEGNLFFKTIAIDSNLQGKGLSKELILASHSLALDLNLNGVYYVNVLEGNKVDSFDKTGSILVATSYLFRVP